MRRRVLCHLGAAGLIALSRSLQARPRLPAPVTVALTAEFGLRDSTSAQAIEQGLRVAIGEVNAAGGVLGGRPIQLITRDDRSIPSRAMRNFEEFLQVPDLVAVFGGKFSPVLMELEPLARRANVPLLAAWASADPVTGKDDGRRHVFRLAARDSWAIRVMAGYLKRQRGCSRIGLLVPNTAWGRSSAQALSQLGAGMSHPVEWYSWGEKTLLPQYRALRAAGMDGLIAVANEREAALLLQEIAALPPTQSVPIAAHSGVTGGDLFKMAGPTLEMVDLAIVQTFTFSGARTGSQQRVLRAASRQPGGLAVERISSVGFAQAYDLMHLLARAVAQAGSTDRTRVRDALERLPSHAGLIKTYVRPFTPGRHDALSLDDVFMTRFTHDGRLVRLQEN